MLSSLFNYDNPVWRFIGKFFDVMILNLLWVVCSIPIVTMGASTTAVYYVTMKLVRDEDGPTIRSFFKSFKENFKQATIIWLILMAVGAIIGFDLYFFMRVQTEASTVRTVMMAISWHSGLSGFALPCLYSRFRPSFTTRLRELCLMRSLCQSATFSILWECWLSMRCWLWQPFLCPCFQL